MSIAIYSISDAAISAQVPTRPPALKKPPPKRSIIAIADISPSPEAR